MLDSEPAPRRGAEAAASKTASADAAGGTSAESRPRPQGPEIHKAAVRRGAGHVKLPPRDTAICPKITGAVPTVMLMRHLPQPPRSLLPSDAIVVQAQAEMPRKIPAQPSQKSLADASAAGLEPQESWPGLGKIPDGLREGFHSLLVVGPSGSGKSTLLRAILQERFPEYTGPLYPGSAWEAGRSLIDAFATAEDGRNLLGGVGLSSVPSWCKPFEVLSVSEKYRANIARALQQRQLDPSLPLVFDEWTSELDRGLARVVSLVFGKRMRREWSQQDLLHQPESETVATGVPVACSEQRCPGASDSTLHASEDVDAEVEGTESESIHSLGTHVPEATTEHGSEAGSVPEDGLEAAADLDQYGMDSDDGRTLSAEDDAAECEDKEEQNEWSQDLLEEVKDASQEEPLELGMAEGTEEGAYEALHAGLSKIASLATEKEGAHFWQMAADAFPSQSETCEEGKAITQEGKTNGMPRGPYIFASCYEDVLAFLQPEFICFCAAGQAPQLVQNPEHGASPHLYAVLRGEVEPLPSCGGGDLLVGSWSATQKSPLPGGRHFVIQFKASREHGVLRLQFDGGEKVEWLRMVIDESRAGIVTGSKKASKDSAADTGSWYMGKSSVGVCEIRVRLLDARTLSMQRRLSKQQPWSKPHRAVRGSQPTALQTLSLALDPREVMMSRQVQDYRQCDPQALRSNGWYLPPELSPEGHYGGLEHAQEPILICPSDFRYNPAFETVEDGQRYLASYVGEADGSLSPKLRDISKLLDWPFDGLCVHRLPRISEKSLGDFCVGMITGPSGSGKSTLARHLFGAPPAPDWRQDTAVIAHFSTLSRARELCEGVDLDLFTAMRPFAVLSGGEQARAKLARLLDTKPSSRDRALVLDEFTSLVDRATARRMAAGVQRLANRRGLKRIVVVSCHNDIVGRGLLEPDWLYECHNGRLLWLRSGEASAAEQGALPWKERLHAAQKASASATAGLALLREQMAVQSSAQCFSEAFRSQVEGLMEALTALGTRELARKHEEEAQLEASCVTAREEALASYRRGLEVTSSTAAAQADHCRGDATLSQVEEQVWMPRALPPPQVELEVRRALPREWARFREHHYKDHSLFSASLVFVGVLNARAACFIAVIREPSNFVYQHVRTSRLKGLSNEWLDTDYPETWARGERRRLYREHRSVVLPDFQGMGLAPLLCDTVALMFLESGHDFTSQTVHPFYGGYRDRSPFWRPLPTNRKARAEIKGNLKYSHFFVGATMRDGTDDPMRAAELRRRVFFERDEPAVARGAPGGSGGGADAAVAGP